MADKQLLDVSHVSKRGSSLRITLPRKICEKLGIESEDIIGFYVQDGKVVVEKIH